MNIFSFMNQISAQRLRAGPGCICSRDRAQPVPPFSCQCPQIQRPLKVPSPPFSPPSWMETLSFPSQTAGQQFSRGKVSAEVMRVGWEEAPGINCSEGRGLTPNPPVLFSCLSLPRLLRGEAGKGLQGPGRPKPPARGEQRPHPAPGPAGAVDVARGSLPALLGFE